MDVLGFIVKLLTAELTHIAFSLRGELPERSVETGRSMEPAFMAEFSKFLKIVRAVSLRKLPRQFTLNISELFIFFFYHS